MFSITRRLRSMEATSVEQQEKSVVPPFLSDASDYDLANITMTAIQAEREEILQTQEDIQRNISKKSFEEAKLLSRRTRVRVLLFLLHLLYLSSSSSSFFFHM